MESPPDMEENVQTIIEINIMLLVRNILEPTGHIFLKLLCMLLSF